MRQASYNIFARSQKSHAASIQAAGDEVKAEGDYQDYSTGVMSVKYGSDKTQLISEGLTSELAAELLAKFGRNELEEKQDPKWLIVSSLALHCGGCPYSITL